MKIKIGDPRIIHQGPPSEDCPWGVMQFPFVFKAKDGKIYVKMLAVAENWETIGTRNSHIWFCSEDEGQTWLQVPEPVGSTGTELPNGEKIYFPSRDAIVLDPKEIKYWPGFTGQLPSDKPVKEPDGSMPYPTYRFYDQGLQLNLVYDFDHLPDEYAKKEWLVERTDINGNTKLETARLDIPTLSGVGVIQHSGKFVMLRPAPWAKGPKVAPDGSVWITNYTFGHLNPYNKAPSPRSAILVYKSTDNAKSFQLHSYIQNNFDTNKRHNAWIGNGVNESDIEFMDDGSMIIIMRTVDVFGGGPEWSDLLIARSTDGGKTWSEPEVFDTGILPSVVKLGCGVTLAAYGRPGIYVRGTVDPSGMQWEPPVEVMTPNDRSYLMNNPPERPDFHQYCGSCCNVDLKPLDDNRAILIYSDFYVPDASGKTDKKLKSMMCRIITVDKE